MANLKEISKWLVIIGGVVGLLQGILTIIGGSISLITVLTLNPLIMGIIAILISLVVLATSGVVNIPALKFDNNWIILLILGILLFVFASDIAGILVIIGAILLVVE